MEKNDSMEMGVMEALGLEGVDELSDDEALDFGIGNVFDIHKKTLEQLSDVDAHLEEFILEYEAGKKSDREPVEDVYALKLGLIETLAKLYNPMSSFGRKQLLDAVSCRKEFETLVGPMVSVIAEDNMELFSSVLNEDLMEDIRVGRMQAIGALRTRYKRTYGVAAIAWHIDQIPYEDNGVVRIDWLYVHEAFRGRGLAGYLLSELIALCNEEGMEHVSVDFSTDNEYKQEIAKILGFWQFSFDTGEDPDIYVRAGDVLGLDTIGEDLVGAKPLSALDSEDGLKAVRDFMIQSGYVGYLLSVPDDYFDMELSCFTGNPEAIRSLLLIHRTPLGMLRTEYFYCKEAFESDPDKLAAALLERVMDTCSDDTLLCVGGEFPELSFSIKKHDLKLFGRYLIEGLLMKPEADVTEEDVKELLALSA